MTSLRHTILRLLEPLRNRVAGMVARAVVTLVDDSKRMQELQLQLLAGEVISGAERVQNYGFTSKPHPPSGDQVAEAVVLFVGGGRDHPLVVAVDDRRHRPRNLEDGESALYDDQGTRVHLQRAQLLLKHPTKIRAEVGSVFVELDASAIRLEIGSSSILLESGKITITTPDLDISSS